MGARKAKTTSPKSGTRRAAAPTTRRPWGGVSHREQAIRVLVDAGRWTEAEILAAADAAGVALEADEEPPVIRVIDAIRAHLPERGEVRS